MHPGEGLDRHSRRHDDNFSHGRPIGGYPTPPTISPGGWRLIGWIIAFLVLGSVASGVIGLLRGGVGSDEDSSDPGGRPVGTPVTAMAVGDCFGLATAHDLTRVTPTSCDAEHIGQIIVRGDLGEGPRSALRQTPTSGCAAAWPPAARQRLDAGQLTESNRIPNEREWRAGDRTVVCSAVIVDFKRPLIGSLLP